MSKGYTPPKEYRDIDGQHRTFTYVDHDIKTKISSSISTEEEVEKYREEIKTYTKNTIDEILALPAISVAGLDEGIYERLIIRDQEKGIIWNDKVARSALEIDKDLRYYLSVMTWKRTVKESNWFHPMAEDHEAIMRGDWKQLM